MARNLTPLTLVACILGCPGVPNEPAASGSTTSSPSDASSDASSGASEESSDGASADRDHILVSVVITDAGRTTYVTPVGALTGHFDNDQGLELPGSAPVLVHDRDVFVGSSEGPTWTKYHVTEDLQFEEEATLSLANLGVGTTGFGNVIVNETTAVSVDSPGLIAIVWNPQTMTIIGEVDLSHLDDPNNTLENWTTTTHDGLVYIPGRWGNVLTGTVVKRMSVTILDPASMSIVGVAEDERCYSSGRVVFDQEGYGYVMADGRNWSAQAAAMNRGEPVPPNCILRIAPGETDFDDDYYFEVPALTGGVDAITELETNQQGSGIGFAKMFHTDELPEGYTITDFGFWNLNVHRLWRIDLADPPSARVVEDAPFSVVGYGGQPLRGKLWVGESVDDGGTSTVYAVDPETDRMEAVFTMAGYYNGVFGLTEP